MVEENIQETVEVTPTVEPRADYDLHIMLAREMQPVLKDAALLAFKMEDIPKPDLLHLMNLFIGWGLAIQKKKWLDRMGYR